MRVHILGSGTSSGVPVIGCHCKVCMSKDPKNHRTRASIALVHDGQTLLVDTAPEMRLQVLRAGIDAIDGLLYTHMHADHTAGFDDLRGFYFKSRTALNAYLLPEYAPDLKARFRYAFEDTGYYGVTPQVTLHSIPDAPFTIAGFPIDPVRLVHGNVPSCGFRVGRFAYVTDFKNFPTAKIAEWRGKIDVMVASGIHFGTHPTHSVIPETLQLFDDLGVKRGIISHLAHDVDYVEHAALLPDFAEYSFDGMTIDLEAFVS
ncbi:MAG: MBL fold metallo-hydrolase [Chitinophagaceae bacterium]|nr:MBL fold metallo-hydrolase [Oligoflexus sp.]